jgi:hypothetical protein
MRPLSGAAAIVAPSPVRLNKPLATHHATGITPLPSIRQLHAQIAEETEDMDL